VTLTQICPNCGASIVGKADHCPRCDFDLSAAVTMDADDGLETLAETAPTMDDVPEPDPNMPDTLAEPDTDRDEPEEVALSPAETNPAQTTPAQAPQSVDPALAATVSSDISSFDAQKTGELDPNLIGSTSLDETMATAIPAEILKPESMILEDVPPAPYTPPPLREATMTVAPYSYPSNYYLEQRMAAYRQGGYELVDYTPYQTTLRYGKPLGFLWWLVALSSGVGFWWYFMILLTSGFSKDRVFLIVERDGTLYEDGAGSAHTRKQRARVGRRWGVLGVVIFFMSLLWFVGMVAAGVYASQTYAEELKTAYPEITLFDDTAIDAESLNPDDVQLAENGLIAYVVLFGMSILCLFMGLTFIIVGYLHHAAYDVSVAPLPA